MSIMSVVGAIVLSGHTFFAFKDTFFPEKKVEAEDLAATVVPSVSFGTAVKALLCDAQVWILGVFVALNSVAMTVFDPWGKMYIEAGLGKSSLDAMSSLSMAWIGVIPGILFYAWFFAPKAQDKTVTSYISGMRTGTVLSLTGFLIMIYVPLCATSIKILCLLIGFFTGGSFCSFSQSGSYIKNHPALRTVSGFGAGFHNGMSMVGGTLLQIPFGMIVDYYTKSIGEPAAYRIAIFIIPITLFLSLVITFFIKPIEVVEDKDLVVAVK